MRINKIKHILKNVLERWGQHLSSCPPSRSACEVSGEENCIRTPCPCHSGASACPSGGGGEVANSYPAQNHGCFGSGACFRNDGLTNRSMGGLIIK